MSLQVNLSSKDIGQAYQDVVNANGIDWAIFTYEKGSNDLKVQGTGDGGLEELEEEFSDGRCVSTIFTIMLLTRDIQDPIRFRPSQRSKCEPEYIC